MPVYTYRCENCGVRFDHTAKFSDPPLNRCPECGKKALKKVYLPVGIVFKGSGFYATDHKSPSGGKKFPSPLEGKGATESGSTNSGAETAKSDAREARDGRDAPTSSAGSETTSGAKKE